MLIKAKCELINTQVQVKICRRVLLPYWYMGGATCESSPSEAQSRKVVRIEEMKIIIIDLKWIMRKAKLCPLDRFSILPSHGFSERPDYRIDSRTIKRGSRLSILIVLFVESSNLCILAIIYIGSYLSFIMVWPWCLSCLS